MARVKDFKEEAMKENVMIEYMNEGRVVGMARYPEGDQRSMAQDQSVKKDAGKYRPTLVPAALIEAVARVRERGIAKYGNTESWRKVEDIRYLDAIGRHYFAIVGGEWIDRDSGLPHLDHIACNVAFLIENRRGREWTMTTSNNGYEPTV